jgi:hypothetical protein
LCVSDRLPRVSGTADSTTNSYLTSHFKKRERTRSTMVRTSTAYRAAGLSKVSAATASSYPTTAQHLWDGREAIRGAIRS